MSRIGGVRGGVRLPRMTIANDHDEAKEGEATWLWPLYALLALIASILNHIPRLKRIRPTTKFEPDWRDSWPDLRQCEWLRDQVIAHGLGCLLAGKELDLKATLILDPPADYGGPCPATPFAMNQRFLALARWTTNPEAIIRERYRRLAKRFGVSSCPLRLDASHRSASPVLCTEAETARGNRRRLSSSGASRRGR